MCGKCNNHITETINAFENVSKLLDRTSIQKTYEYEIPEIITPISINETSTIGEQIKYYRQIKGIYQKDIAKLLNIERYTMYHLENNSYKQIYLPEVIRKVINYLEIEDKIIWNDKYVEFIIKDRQHEIRDFRIQNNLTLKEFSNLMKISESTIVCWENNKKVISRKMYNRYIDLSNKIYNNKIVNPVFDYINFRESNPTGKLRLIVKNNNISEQELAKLCDVHWATAHNWLKGKHRISKKHYEKLMNFINDKGIV